MKGIIYYYSLTGNTRLACQYLARQAEAADFELQDIRRAERLDPQAYDVCGFACSTDFMRPPRLMDAFIRELPMQDRKPAFILNTNAGMPGRTLPIMNEWLTRRGFLVFAGHALLAPESYPPLRAIGLSHDGQPNQADLAKFNGFVADLDRSLKHGLQGLQPAHFEVGRLNDLYVRGFGPKAPRVRSKRRLRPELCSECGLCARECPYQAITLDPKPRFDMDKCGECWACYNRCPEQAVYVRPWRRSRYRRPSRDYQRKLGTTEE